MDRFTGDNKHTLGSDFAFLSLVLEPIWCFGLDVNLEMRSPSPQRELIHGIVFIDLRLSACFLLSLWISRSFRGWPWGTDPDNDGKLRESLGRTEESMPLHTTLMFSLCLCFAHSGMWKLEIYYWEKTDLSRSQVCRTCRRNTAAVWI